MGSAVRSGMWMDARGIRDWVPDAVVLGTVNVVAKRGARGFVMKAGSFGGVVGWALKEGFSFRQKGMTRCGGLKFRLG